MLLRLKDVSKKNFCIINDLNKEIKERFYFVLVVNRIVNSFRKKSIHLFQNILKSLEVNN